MRTVEQIKEEFLEIYRQNIKRDGADELLEWMLETDFFEAPASSKYHGNYPGGLAQHSLNVYHELKRLLDASDIYGAKKSGVEYSEETIAIVALLHDLCKAQFYVEQPKNRKIYDADAVAAVGQTEPWRIKNDKLGDFYWETVMEYAIEEEFPVGHGEKSVILIQPFMRLSAEEIYAIRAHMGGWDTSIKGGDRFIGQVFGKCELALFTHIADMMASYLLENE